MNTLPKAIDCHIDEAVFEIRFSTSMQEELLVGAFSFALKNMIVKIEPLAILQLPVQVRNQDPNLRHVPTHTVFLKEDDSIQVSIGPRVLVFSNKKPYRGWDAWMNVVIPILETLLETDIIDSIDRTGLRYINIFPFPILDKINLTLDFPEHSAQNTFSSARMEFEEDAFLIALQVIENARMWGSSADSPFNSVIDIDCINNTSMSIIDFRTNFKSLMIDSHEKEKRFFFSLLKEDFIKSLNPQY